MLAYDPRLVTSLSIHIFTHHIHEYMLACLIYICMRERYIYIYIYRYMIYIYIYMYMVIPPATRTPLKNTVNTDTNAVSFPNPILELFLQIGNTSVKHKNPKFQKRANIQKSKTFHICGILQCFFGFWDFWNFGFLEFWIFGILEFRNFGVWDFLICVGMCSFFVVLCVVCLLCFAFGIHL